MYWLVGIAVLVLLATSLFGSLHRLAIFGGKRRIAVGVGIVALLGGSALLDALDPDKGSEAAAARTRFDAVSSDPEQFIELNAQYAKNLGRLTVSGTMTNQSDYLLTNVKLRCQSNAENGSRLDQASIRVKSLVPPAGSAAFGPLDVMGLDQQTTGAGCNIVDASIADADCANHPTDARCKIDHLP